MPLNMIRQTLEVEELAGAQTAQVLLRAEALVPGAGRESIEALLADADLVIGNVDVQEDRVVVDGTARCQAVYRQGEEATLRALTARTALSHVFDLPGLQAGLPSRVRGQVEHVEARYENGHMVFTVSVALALQVLRLKPVEVITGLEGVEGLQADFREISSVKLAAETGTTATLIEEVALPAALDARTALMDWASVQVESAQSDLGGVRVKGKVALETLISSGVAGRPAALIKYPLAFDQLVSLPDWLSQDVRAIAAARRVDTRVDQGAEGADAVLRIEVELGISLDALQTDRANALADAYTTCGPKLDVRMESIEYVRDIQQLHCAEAFRGTLPLPEDAPSIGTVLAVRALPNLGGWTSENGRTAFAGVIEASILYMPAGTDRLASVTAELPFSVSCLGDVAEDAWVRVEALSADASALMSDQAELRCDLVVHAETRVMDRQDVVADLEESEADAARPGIVLFWPGAEDSPWTVGKRYRLPVQAVVDLNGGKPSLQPGQAVVLKV